MKWALVTVVLVVMSSAIQPSQGKSQIFGDLKYPSNWELSSVERISRELRTTPLTRWDRQTKTQLKKIRTLIHKVKSKHNGCSKAVNTGKLCQLHWIPDTLLRLSVRLHNKKDNVLLKNEKEKMIQEQHLMISKLIENMISVTDCSKGKSDEKKEDSKTSTKSQSKKGSSETLTTKDATKKEKDDITEIEEKKKEAKITGGQDRDGVEETSGSGSGASEGGTEEETDIGDAAAGSGDGDRTGKSSEDEASETSEGDSEAEKQEIKDDDDEKSECDYSNFGETHTMLLPPNECKLHKTGLEEGDKEDILRFHNTLRAKVARGEETAGNPGPQPPAANMRELVWNDQLAEVAEAWAKQCQQGHDLTGNRKICSRNYFVGQNLHFTYSSNPEVDWENAVNSWYKEVADMPREIVNSFRSLQPIKIGHYTQVVWAETYEVGCGIAHYETEISGRFFPEAKVYACNYGDAGNTKTLAMYTEGAAATQCPNGVSENYPDLCA